jgi:hypothetical protein
MTQDILVIHGGNSFRTRQDYLLWLKGKSLTREDLQKQDWKASLGARLGEGFEVFTPRMPNPQNAVYEEWKIWFEKVVAQMNDGAILVGHSLGGVFLAKYLAQEKCQRQIKAIFLVAPLFESAGGEVPEFALPDSLAGVTNQVPKIHLYHSEDDPVIPFDHLFKYQAALPDAVASIFGDRGHFNMAQFPEIVDDIRAAA